MDWIPVAFGSAMALLSAASAVLAADRGVSCQLKCGERVLDKLEAFAMVSFGSQPPCPSANCCIDFKTAQLSIVPPGASRPLWTRLVNFDRLEIGIGNRSIDLDVAEIDGSAPAAPIFVSITPSSAMTGPNGFNTNPITLSVGPSAASKHLYMIRSSYADGASRSYSYGPYIYIKDSHTLSTADKDFIQLRKLRLPGKC